MAAKGPKKKKVMKKNQLKKRKGPDFDALLNNPDSDVSSLTFSQLDKLIMKLFVRILNGDKAAETNLTKRLKSLTSTDDDTGLSEKLWQIYEEVIKHKADLSALPILWAYASCNSPNVVCDATTSLCKLLPSTESEPTLGIRSIIKKALARHDFAEEGDLTSVDDRRQLLAATLEGILNLGDVAVLQELQRTQARIPVETYRQMFRFAAESNEAVVLFILSVLKSLRSDSPIFEHLFAKLYEMPSLSRFKLNSTQGIETYTLKRNTKGSYIEMLHYQSFACFIKTHEDWFAEIGYKESFSIFMKAVTEEWLKYTKTKKPGRPFVVTSNGTITLGAAPKARCLG